MLSIISRIIAWQFKLPPAETYDVIVKRNLKVQMPDGVVLLADHYYPRGGRKLPTVLVRSPYGRAGAFAMLFARPFAERGFQVLIQSCRGTFGSGGTFDAFRNERSDGLATLAWLKRQRWFNGEMAMVGPSYLGLVQWAIAAEAGPMLKAMAPQITASEFRSMTYPGESFGLDTALTWVRQMTHQEKPLLVGLLDRRKAVAQVGAAFRSLPLRNADKVASDRVVPYYRDWLDHNEPDDEWWKKVDFSATVGQVTAPVNFVGGWYDFLLPYQLRDYDRLRAAGRQPHLTIGPWTHTSPAAFPVMVNDSITWFRAQLLNDRTGLRKAPVKVFVMGQNKWREFADWPPAGYQAQRWHLQDGRRLAIETPGAAAPDHYRYDPADPTPSIGGASISANSGPRDNSELESRSDVLVYSSAPLTGDLEAIGPVSAELFVSSSLQYTDFCVRLCDVDASGKSINVCDGILRLAPDEQSASSAGYRQINIELWPTAYRFLQGHRIRVQVSSGAHPRWVRNTGSGEPLATATKLVSAEQTVYHDPEHPSAILLPVKVV